MEDDPSVFRQLVETGQGDVIAIDPDGGIVEIGETSLRLRKQTEHEGLEVLSPSITEHGSLLFKDDRDGSYIEIEFIDGGCEES
ncbi:hypothetical protein [Halorussus sp. AFM4]|uniref:hypothetical protein n=1 Tax=Halorussus sp. AFM4 TaxID=3421651 RepID=UPI003EC121D2